MSLESCTRMAAEMRSACNHLTTEQRQELVDEAMNIIDGRPRQKTFNLNERNKEIQTMETNDMHPDAEACCGGNCPTEKPEHEVINPHDDAYAELVRTVMSRGYRKENRTKYDTLGVFGAMAQFDLQKGFPLLTTKKMAWKTIVRELLWFISGGRNVRELMVVGCNIWNDNAYAFYRQKQIAKTATVLCQEDWKKRLLEDPDFLWAGDMGKVYGNQWRHWGDYEMTVEPAGIDQLAKAVKMLKETPDARDILVTAWDPSSVGRFDIALPPCHVLFQFNSHVHKEVVGGDIVERRVLDLALTQRSCDLFLGVPFNVASYALLLTIMAHHVGMIPGTFTHFYGDLHIYENHFEQMQEQVSRLPYAPPRLGLNMDSPKMTLTDYKLEDFVLCDYKCHDAIKGDMAV